MGGPSRKIATGLRSLGLTAALLCAVAAPANADLAGGFPQVSFPGVVQGFSPDSIAIGTPGGTVLVPTAEGTFYENGMLTGPSNLTV